MGEWAKEIAALDVEQDAIDAADAPEPEMMELLPNVAYLGIYEDTRGEIGIEFNYTPGTLSPAVQQTVLGLYQFLSTEEGRKAVFDAGDSFEQPKVPNNGEDTND
jgi:hypothetical protein|tara:strand:+ start:8585 stop:8899 length:315 start_codon:yes stop_codon:yes gene_type:complete